MTTSPRTSTSTGPGTTSRAALFILRTPDPAAVSDFYGSVLGWEYADETFTLRGEPVAGATAREGGWIPMFAVTALEETQRKVEDAGGSLVGSRDDERGLQALATDPIGTAFGLWQVGTGAGTHAQGRIGTVSWVEQKTWDQDGATAFLSSVFGHQAVGPTGPGKVRMLMTDGPPPVGGVMQFDDRYPADQSPFWLLYAQVDDVAAAIDRAVAAGGSLWIPVTETPIGPIAYVRDPVGNAIALVTFTPSPTSS